MAGKVSLDKWIRECMLDEERDGKLTMLTLVHMVGAQESEIHTVRMGTKTWDCKALGNMFYGKATAFAQDLPGVHYFCLLAFWGDRDMPGARQPFMVKPNQESLGLFSEAPTPEGEKMQRMRHNEALISQVYHRQNEMDRFALEYMREMSRANLDLVRENREAFGIVKELLMKQALDSHNYEMEKLKYARDTEERKKWLSYAPPLINTILGREVFPQNSADTHLIEQVAEALDEESIMKLAQMLPPSMWGPIAARFQGALEKKRKEQEQAAAMRAIAERHPDPEADAAGDMPRRLPNGSH